MTAGRVCGDHHVDAHDHRVRGVAAGGGAQPDGVHARLPHHPGLAWRGVPGDHADRELHRACAGATRTRCGSPAAGRRSSRSRSPSARSPERVLSFEFGLLWPAFTGRFGKVFGVLFAIEGIFFFLEAIFVAIYIFGWKRLAPWTHFWAGVPIVITGLGGAFSVVAVNSWMNQPQGFSPTTRRRHQGRAAEGDLQPGGALRGPAHDPRGLPGHRVPRRLGLRGRACCAGAATATTGSGC